MGLQYLTITCLSYGVNFVGMPFHASTSLLNTFCVIYVEGSTHFGMQNLASNTLDLYAFSDLDWVGCSTSHQSTTGFCTICLFVFFFQQLHLLECKRKGRLWPSPILKLSINAWLQLKQSLLVIFPSWWSWHSMISFLMEKKWVRGQPTWQSYLGWS